MPAGKSPGPYCAHNNPLQVEDGTMCRAPSPPPGPVGASGDPGFSGFLESTKSLAEACRLAVSFAPAAVYQETGYQLGSLIKGLVPGLLEMIVALGAATVAGAGIGAAVGFFAGGAGAVPGAVIGGDLGFDAGMAILSWLGVAFLLKSIRAGLGELTALISTGCQRAWHARQRCGGQPNIEIDRAAHDLAKAVGVLIRLLLEGVVAYLLKNAAISSSRAAVATGQAVRGAGSEFVADQTVAELVGKLRASRLGDGFATWVEKNWKELVKDPRLRPKGFAAGSAAASDLAASTQSVVGRSARPPIKSTAAIEDSEAPALASIEINGLKADRILPGTNGKVAIIGRSMQDVTPYANGLADRGYNVEIFDQDVIPRPAQRQWDDLTSDGRRLSDDEVRATELYKANEVWAQKLKQDGYTVVDIDNPRGLKPSPFYSMEQTTIFGGGGK